MFIPPQFDTFQNTITTLREYLSSQNAIIGHTRRNEAISLSISMINALFFINTDDKRMPK